jgi:glucose 1-dehydrogenase
MIRPNLYGPSYCCQLFIRTRKAADGTGKIINITSVHQEIPRAGAVGYDSSKDRLRNLTRTLTLEPAPDRINVNNIAPGMVLTPMNQPALDDPAKFGESCRLDVCYRIERWIIGFQRTDAPPSQVRPTFPVCR